MEAMQQQERSLRVRVLLSVLTANRPTCRHSSRPQTTHRPISASPTASNPAPRGQNQTISSLPSFDAGSYLRSCRGARSGYPSHALYEGVSRVGACRWTGHLQPMSKSEAEGGRSSCEKIEHVTSRQANKNAPSAPYLAPGDNTLRSERVRRRSGICSVSRAVYATPCFGS